MAETQQLSQEAFDRLQNEFEDLKTRGRIEIAKKIETARELGDLSENGDYHAAKEEQGKMEGRIAHLGSILVNAEIVEGRVDLSEVQAGCVVSITFGASADVADDDVEKYLLGSIEERRKGIDVMSPGSAMGKALIGAKVGETVQFEAPAGPIEVTVVAIEP